MLGQKQRQQRIVTDIAKDSLEERKRAQERKKKEKKGGKEEGMKGGKGEKWRGKGNWWKNSAITLVHIKFKFLAFSAFI